MLEAGWPEDAIAVVLVDRGRTPLVEDERIKLLTFTGSPAVGWALKGRAGRKRVALELGGNAPVVVDRDADAEYASQRIAWGATVQSGQTCISVQRVYVHSSLWDEVVPRSPRTWPGCGSAIPWTRTRTSARSSTWTPAARSRDGCARLSTAAPACSPAAGGAALGPTVLTDVRDDARLCEEASLRSSSSLLSTTWTTRSRRRPQRRRQARIFTRDGDVGRAFDEIEVGGLVVNDVPTFRIDHMPYGGVKQSGFGREGIRYAIEEMTEMKLVTLNPGPAS